MSILIMRTVCCDGELDTGPCAEWFGDEDASAPAVRLRAKKRGWTRRSQNGRVLDLCPECSRPTPIGSAQES